MTRQDIIDQMVKKTDLTVKEATQAVEAIIDIFEEAFIGGENIYIRGLATFKQVIRKEKKVQNITRGHAMTMPAYRSVKLIIPKELKDKMNDGFEA